MLSADGVWNRRWSGNSHSILDKNGIIEGNWWFTCRRCTSWGWGILAAVRSRAPSASRTRKDRRDPWSILRRRWDCGTVPAIPVRDANGLAHDWFAPPVPTGAIIGIRIRNQDPESGFLIFGIFFFEDRKAQWNAGRWKCGWNEGSTR